MYFLLRRPARGLTLSYGSAKQQAGKAICIDKAERRLTVWTDTLLLGGNKMEIKEIKKGFYKKVSVIERMFNFIERHEEAFYLVAFSIVALCLSIIFIKGAI